VQVRGDVGAFVRALPGRTLLTELAPQPEPPRCEDESRPCQHRRRGDHGRDHLRAAHVLAHEEEHADQDEDDAAREPEHDVGRPAPGPRQPPAPLGLVELAPGDPEPCEGDEDRQHPGPLDRHPEPAHDERSRRDDEQPAHEDVPHRHVRPPVLTLGVPHLLPAGRDPRQGRVPLLRRDGSRVTARHRRPEEDVRQHADATAEGEDRRHDAHGAHREVEVRGDAEADAPEETVPGWSAQREACARGAGWDGRWGHTLIVTRRHPPGGDPSSSSGSARRRIRGVSGEHPMVRSVSSEKDRRYEHLRLLRSRFRTRDTTG
jgi:hypothetical protein